MWGCQQSEEKQLWTLLRVFFTLFFFFLSQQVDKMFYTCILIHIRHICRQNVFKEGDINGNLYLLWFWQNFAFSSICYCFHIAKFPQLKKQNFHNWNGVCFDCFPKRAELSVKFGEILWSCTFSLEHKFWSHPFYWVKQILELHLFWIRKTKSGTFSGSHFFRHQKSQLLNLSSVLKARTNPTQLQNTRFPHDPTTHNPKKTQAI